MKQINAFWWNKAPNFGDLLTPWLIQKISGLYPILNQSTPHYLVIGSILGYAKQNSIVWGSGSFGVEDIKQLPQDAQYLAVRGPLTRNLIRIAGIKCPDIYGDPALLVPEFYWPISVSKIYEIGLVLRHSEFKLLEQVSIPGVKIIYLKTDKIEETIDEIYQCKRIATTSLHGLIIADAYGIPNAWLSSTSPYGLEFKFYDYFLSVDKIRPAQKFNLFKGNKTIGKILNEIIFDSRPIKIDLKLLRQYCPF
jgi:pyruvyltransferase